MKAPLLFLAIFLTSNSILFAMEKTLTWQTTDPKTNESIVVGEKGSIQEAYINAGRLPDPHLEMNEKLFGWFEEHLWDLTSSIHLDESDLSTDFIDLDLPSVDAYANVYVNGKLVITCDNAFAPYRVNVKPFLQVGENEILVTFTPPVIYHKASYKAAPYKLPAENDKHLIAIAPYTRKPQYQFGWDWTMRMNTIGFNKPVKLVGYNHNAIINASVQTLSIDGENAQVSFAIELAQNDVEIESWNSALFGTLQFSKEGNWLTAIVDVKDAKLWWPVNYGDPFLYHDTWSFGSKDGRSMCEMKKRFGIRTTELVQQKDTFGTSYEIVINGLKIFCKGGDYIPQEIFPAKVTEASIRSVIDQMADANFNMVRVWGGGYYPDEVFFDECDEKGIMVWQDFMFACAMYPGDEAFLATVQQELDYHIPRMTSHPSVVLLNGNNEVMIAWKNWGFQRKFSLNQTAQTEIATFYDNLFHKAIPKSVKEFSTVPYVHTSPLSNWGKDDFYNHGSQHYWGVWHGKDPIEDFGNKIGRFNSEYGFQSFPEYSTMCAVLSDKNTWSLDSDELKLRQKSYVGNSMIKKHADLLFGIAADFETFIYHSQLTQSRAVSMAIAGHRSDWPRCAGTLFWQVNDCWPAPTWSSMDYYGNWKALHYEAKKDFENIAVVAREKKMNEKEFFLISDWTTEYNTDITFDFYDLNGNWLVQHTFITEVNPQTVVELPVFKLMDNYLEEYVVVIKWKNASGEKLSRSFYNSKKPILSVHATVTIALENDGSEQQIVLTTDKPLLNCWIYSENKSFHLDRNFETLLPGKHVFKVLRGDTLTEEDVAYRVVN